MRRLSRRTLLRAAGTSLALPWLESFAQSAPPPTRLLLFFTPNGTLREQWLPTVTTTGFTLTGMLSPLAPVQSQLVVVGDVDMTSAGTGPGDGHQKGIGQVWTNTALQPGILFSTVDWAGGPSVDQVAADTLGARTALRSLELGVQVPGARIWDRMVYRAAGQPLPPQLDPAQVFTQLFGGQDPVQAARRRALRQSVLDGVLGELSALRTQVSAADARTLDAHTTTVRELEQRLSAVAAPAPGCAVPAAPQVPDLLAAQSYGAIGALQLELLALALACDLTRVGSVQWSCAASAVVFGWLGQNVDHHELSHRADTDTAAQASLTAIGQWYSRQFLTLVQRLASFSEGAGTVLDHTLVVWGNELGRGNVHSHTSVPFLLAGGASGGLTPGRFVDAAHGPHGQLLVSCLNAVGVPTSTFGDPATGTGELPGLR